MNRYATHRYLDISCIDFDDFSYCLSPGREVAPDNLLTESIARHGIIHPPIVKETLSGSHAVVSGRRRLLAFRSLIPRENSCCCMIFSADAPEAVIFSVLLEEILSRRQLTPIEKALFLQKTSAFLDENAITENFLARLGLPRDAGQILLGKILLDLEEILVQAVHRGDLPESTARELIPLAASDRLAVYEIISTLHLGINYQRKLLTVCRELADREERTIASLLKDTDIQKIISHRDANPPQKAKNLMGHLMRRYKPRISQAEAEFNRMAASLQLPKNISLGHAPSFEDDSLTLTITIPDNKSLPELIRIIKDATGTAEN